MPRLRVFAGPNGSGKSTLLETLPAEWIGIYINADDVERAIKRAGEFDLAAFELGDDAATRFERLRNVLLTTARLENDLAERLARQLNLVGTRVQVPADVMDSYIAARQRLNAGAIGPTSTSSRLKRLPSASTAFSNASIWAAILWPLPTSTSDTRSRSAFCVWRAMSRTERSSSTTPKTRIAWWPK